MSVEPQCPVPMSHSHVTLGHGGGGRLMHELIERLIRPRLRNASLDAGTDAAVLSTPGTRLAFTTDSYVVRPIFFPGGDIGKLAVCGTVNDLATAGAVPQHLSLTLILEEGLAFADLERVLDSVAAAARECGVQVVTGDTKVVERGRCEQMYLTTSGVGAIEHDLQLAPASIAEGDRVVLSGDLGRHGAAIMSLRSGIQLQAPIQSDVAPIHRSVLALLDAGIQVRCLRDLTRGGLSSALHELATGAGLTLGIRESAIKVSDPVQGVCELLGLDPLSLPNEGRFVAVVAPEDAARCVALLQEHNPHVSLIGEAHGRDPAAAVWAETGFGVKRAVQLPSGELLPRIC